MLRFRNVGTKRLTQVVIVHNSAYFNVDLVKRIPAIYMTADKFSGKAARRNANKQDSQRLAAKLWTYPVDFRVALSKCLKRAHTTVPTIH